MNAARSGAALLEVIAALLILSISGVAAAALAIESARAVRIAREADAEMRAAGAFLDAVALWPREDLDRRLGERSQGPWRLSIQRPYATLYVVMLTDSTAGRLLLHTSLYRPEAENAVP